MIDEITKAYVAGLFDGEGHCAIQKRISSKLHQHYSYVADLRIVNTNRSVLEFIQTLYGGIIYTRGKPVSSKHRQSWQWYGYGETLERFLQDILPYLQIKRLEVENLLKFKSIQPPKRTIGVKGVTMTEQERELQEYYYQIDSQFPGRRLRKMRT